MTDADIADRARWAKWQREKNRDESVALRSMIELDLLAHELMLRRLAQSTVSEA